MTHLELTSLYLLGAVVAAAIFRGVLDRAWVPFLVALAAFAPLVATCAHLEGLIDISSARHPVRIGSSLVALSAAMLGAHLGKSNGRTLLACLITFSMACTSVPALLAWQLPGEWVLVPLQITACVAVLVVLLVPERWVSRWIR